MSEQSERALRHAAEQLASLKRLEPWQFLKDTIAKKRVRMAEMVAQRILGDPNFTAELAQRQIDHDRGYVAGMKYVFDVVDGAERTLSGARSSKPDEAEEDFWEAPLTQ